MSGPEQDDGRRGSGGDPRDPGGVRITPRMWVVGALWVALAFVAALFATKKAFRWTGEVDSYQQERSSEEAEGDPIRDTPGREQPQ